MFPKSFHKVVDALKEALSLDKSRAECFAWLSGERLPFIMRLRQNNYIGVASRTIASSHW